METQHFQAHPRRNQFAQFNLVVHGPDLTRETVYGGWEGACTGIRLRGHSNPDLIWICANVFANAKGSLKKNREIPITNSELWNPGGGGPEFSKKSEFHKQGVQKGIKTLIRP